MRFLVTLSVILSLFYAYTIGYYVGYYDRTTSLVVADAAFKKWKAEIADYTGPVNKMVINGDNITLSKFIVVGFVTDKSPAVYMKGNGRVTLDGGLIDIDSTTIKP